MALYFHFQFKGRLIRLQNVKIVPNNIVIYKTNFIRQKQVDLQFPLWFYEQTNTSYGN